MEDIKKIVEECELKHIAIIMDGNRRWAKERNLPSALGHKKGVDALKAAMRACDDFGVKYLTVYAFSTENWKRSESEVQGLMKILRNYLKTCIKRAREKNMKVVILGKQDMLDEDIIRSINELEESSKNNTGLVFQIALNYGARDEMVRAMRKMTKDMIDKEIAPEMITEDMFASYLDTADAPDPDLIIRTSGEKRISNFLLWQCAYSEFDFPEVLWPDFNKKRLIEAVERYNKRDRRFGGVKEE